MARRYHRVVLLFLDGVGLGADSAHNPLARCPAPTLGDLLGGPLTVERIQAGSEVTLAPLDATLGVEGLPQSATGQTALFAGANGAAALGRHLTGFPGPSLWPLIEEGSIFRRTVERGGSATFANAYTAGYLVALERGEARASVTTRAVNAAGLSFRTVEDLAAGRAVTWDVERDLFGRRPGSERRDGGSAPIEAERAGRHLARLAAHHDLTVFESFLPDLVGHGRVDLAPAEVVRRIDDLLAGFLAERPPAATLVVTSDHGNFEDSRVRTHTRTPVPLLAAGPAAARFAGLESILQVTPAILELLAGASS